MNRTAKRILLGLAAAGPVALTAIALRPQPARVETARAVKGPLQVTVDEDGQTRAHDRFILAAPVAGRLARIKLHEGDTVGPETVVATISQLPLDPREVAETRARVQSAEALKREADEQVARAKSDHNQAQLDFNRAKELSKERIIAQQELEQVQSKEISAAKTLEAAKFRAQSASAEVKRAEAGLIALEAQQDQGGKTVTLRPPARCRILRILETSERVVASGTPLVVLSDPTKIEIVVDLLSTDAVRVRTGAPVSIENWGGPAPLRARVRLVEPYGFLKVSALGVEEQRANVIADFVDPPDGLGDGYRVDARIVTWESPRVLKVPASALFRAGSSWCAFVLENGRARLRQVDTGHRNALEAEITTGLEEGTEVILHPSNELKDGARVAIRR